MCRLSSQLLTLAISTVVSVGVAVVVVSRYAEDEGEVLDFHTVDERVVDEVSRDVAERAALETAEGRLLRAALDEETVREMMPLKGPARNYNPFCYFHRRPGLSLVQKWNEHPNGKFPIVTNSLGLRSDRELAETAPDLRILVAGDSHIDGVCANAECFPSQLEERLLAARPERSVEVINGSSGAYSFYHYLGVLERVLDLGVQPDLFVMVVYGGNDFLGVFLWHFFHATLRPKNSKDDLARRDEVAEKYPQALGQALNAAAYFRRGGPREVETALRMGREATREVQRLCAEEGIELLVMYLPSPTEMPKHADQEKLVAGAEVMRLSGEDLDLLGTMADRYLEEIAALGVPTIDLRPSFRSLQGPLYWARDLHLNLEGHKAAADLSAPWIESRWDAWRE